MNDNVRSRDFNVREGSKKEDVTVPDSNRKCIKPPRTSPY